jgi:hypothetical protein
MGVVTVPRYKEAEMTRTRLGKEVGSVKTDPEGWTYWPERNWTTNEPGFQCIAPSGARMGWFRTEAEAREKVARENEIWFSDRDPA